MKDFYRQYDEWHLEPLRRDLPDYVDYRNYVRGHRALGGKPASTRLREQIKVTSLHMLDHLESYAHYEVSRRTIGPDGTVRMFGRKGDVGKEEVEITKEIKGYLYDRKDILCKNPYRIIHAKKKEEVWDEKKAKKVRCKILRKKHEGVSRKSLEEEQLKEELIIVTNLPEEEYGSREVLELYKKRWDIEVFFKFLKQELGFSHFINRSENGIKVVMYIRMLFAILLLIYKMKNNLEGYKYVKSAMMRELEVEFIRYVIEKSGGKYEALFCR